MRHVVLGSNTPIGSSVIRLLASINADNIVAVSPTGTLPEGVDPKKVEIKYGDVVDIYAMNELLEEDDVIYNCQIISDELADPEEAEIYNNIGFVNLLGVATSTKVNRIVCALPQTIGYKLPEVAQEEDFGAKISPVKKTIKGMIDTSKKYMEGESFGWRQARIAKFAEQARLSESNEQEKYQDDSPIPDQDIPSDSKGPSLGPSIPNSSEDSSSGQSSGPNLGPSPSGSSSGPSLSAPSASGPNLGEGKTETDSDTQKDTLEEVETEPEEQLLVDTIEFDDSLSGEEVSYEPVPLILGRIARLFGPFEEEFTSKVCKSVRLQRMTVKGPHKKPITWINPLDAGRAMIIMGDPSVDVEPGQYLINGFTASPREIFNAMDKINHSKLDLEVEGLFGERIKHVFKNLLSLVGFSMRDQYYKLLEHNTRQVFDDSKAREAFGWKPKFDLKRTVKDAMNWFISHQL